MSVVAVRKLKNKIIIGSDSIRVHGYTQEKLQFAKLRKVNEIVIGSCGLAYESSLLFLFCKTHSPTSAEENDILEFLSEFQDWVRKKTGINAFTVSNEYVLIFAGKIYRIQNFLIQEIEDYTAIGAGMDYALSALYLGADVAKAVETACELSIFCEKPVNIVEIDL